MGIENHDFTFARELDLILSDVEGLQAVLLTYRASSSEERKIMATTLPDLYSTFPHARQFTRRIINYDGLRIRKSGRRRMEIRSLG